MQKVLEKEIVLPKVLVRLASFQSERTENVGPQFSGHYNLCQRLSDNHSALIIDNLPVREAFPRVRSVGFLPPDSLIRLHPMDQAFRGLTCVFDRGHFEEATEIEQQHWEEHAASLVSIKNRNLETLMQKIYAELVQPGFGQDLLIEAASTMILVEMARYGRRLRKTNGQRGADRGLAPWQLRHIHERIEASLEIGYPSLVELAQLCGICESHLMHTFKASTGWPIHKYITEERMKAARLMLAQDQLRTREISARLGFRSPAYFSTAFVRMTGMTPTEYRRQARATGKRRA
jgi:AraC family transcriptional regulator